MNIPFELHHESNNPLDLIEELSEAKKWEFIRHTDTGMNISMPGKQDIFDISMEWQEEFSALLMACSVPIEITENNYEMLAHAMERINQNLWLGHFDMSNKGKFPTFRYTILLRMIPAGISVRTIADVFEIAIAECNRFYSTFQKAKEGDIRLHDDLSAAVFETVGEA